MFDLVVRNGLLVSGDRCERSDIGVKDGKVSALLPPGSVAVARAELHVDGRFILPGLVDAHAHLREPGLTQKEDFSSGTKAAIAGGVTTVLVMPTDDPWTETEEQFRSKQELANGRIHSDVAFQVAVGRRPQPLNALVGLGAASFEIFTADVPSDFLHATPQDVMAAVRRVSEAGGLAAISPADNAVRTLAGRRSPSGRNSIDDFIASFPPESEVSGIARNALIAAVAGIPVHIRQISSAAAVNVFRDLRKRADVTIETSPQCLHFSSKDYETQGPFLKASPPLRSLDDVEALRQAIRDRTVDMVVTDHAPHTRAEKLGHPDNFSAVPGGMPGLQTLLPAMLSLVSRKAIDLTDVVRVCAEGPAKRFGLANHKGFLRQGSDADFVILDPNRSTTVRNEDQLSKAAYTVFDRMRVPYWIEHVYLRGEEVLGPQGVSSQPRGVCVSCRH